MITEAIFAFLHYISFIVLLCALVTEWVVYDKVLTPRQAKTLMTADSIYGMAAMSVIITGFLKVFYFGKGADYYFSNYIFYIKIGLVLIIGLLSVYPTLRFLKWRNPLKEGATEIVIEENEYQKTRRLKKLEMTLAVAVPLLAALMARGIGF